MNWLYQIIRTTPAHLCLFYMLVLSFYASCNLGKTVVAHRRNITCIDQERDALLKFKHHIKFDYCGLMASWGNPNTPDCCTWNGVSCSNQSSHVIGLHLSGDPYHQDCLHSPVFSPSLGKLKHLKYLDLSSSYFYGMVIPSSIGSLVNLVYLNLSDSGFYGNIPRQFRNLTSLTSLDLSHNQGLSAKSLNWLSRLTSLKDINLGGSDLSKANDWFRIIDSLPLLEVLKMDGCQLSTPPPSSSFLQSANFHVISLSGNGFSSFSSFQWLFNTSNYSSVKNRLKYLDLSGNLLQGLIPGAIRNLEFLTYLDLSSNFLSGTIPDAIGNLEFLAYLDLSSNLFSSTIPSTMGDSRSISHIDLSNNHLQGSIPTSFGELSSLLYLSLSNNQLESSIPASMANLKYVKYLDLSSNHLSGDIPRKIGTRESLAYFNFSFNDLSGSIPEYYLSNFCIMTLYSFQGNPNLPVNELWRICKTAGNLSSEEQVGGDHQHKKDKINIGLYVSIGLGFYTGFWVFCGTLTVKNSWRQAYFQFLDRMIDKIYVIVIVTVNLARFRRNSEV